MARLTDRALNDLKSVEGRKTLTQPLQQNHNQLLSWSWYVDIMSIKSDGYVIWIL